MFLYQISFTLAGLMAPITRIDLVDFGHNLDSEFSRSKFEFEFSKKGPIAMKQKQTYRLNSASPM